MRISNIPKNLHEVLDRCDLLKPKMCFGNCFLAVMNTISKEEFDVHYVLGSVTTEDGHEFDHALIKCNGKYHDPTLEPQGLHLSSTYKIEKEFSPDEIMYLLKQTFPMPFIKKMVHGEEPWWPLQRTSPGIYEFVDA